MRVLPGQSYCLGKGTQVDFSDEDAIQFKLQGLSGGAACNELVAGSLIGCWR